MPAPNVPIRALTLTQSSFSCEPAIFLAAVIVDRAIFALSFGKNEAASHRRSQLAAAHKSVILCCLLHTSSADATINAMRSQVCSANGYPEPSHLNERTWPAEFPIDPDGERL